MRNTRSDFFGNEITYLTVQMPHARLTIRAFARVEVQAFDAALLNSGPAWERSRGRTRSTNSKVALEASQFAFASPYIESMTTLRVRAMKRSNRVNRS